MRWQIFQAPHSNNPILSVYRGVGGIVMRIRWSTQSLKTPDNDKSGDSMTPVINVSGVTITG